MRLLAARPRSALLLTAFFLTTNTLAQRTTAAAQPAPADPKDDSNNDTADPTNNRPPALETRTPDAPTTAPPAAAPTTNKPANPPLTVEVPKTTNTADNKPAETPKPAETNKPAEDTPADNPAPATTSAGREETFTLSEAPDAATSTNTVSAPIPDATITGSTGAGAGKSFKPPTLAPTGVPIPTPQVPPTANAPYMQESTMPAGTVFIAVGAVLGAFFLAVLLWRGLTVWALKRNMRRAAERVKGGAASGDTKQLLNFRRPEVPLGGYREGNRDSMMSLGRMGGGARTPGRGGRPQTASSAQGHASSLFFSPTAQGAGGMQNNRGSTYLPSGYYAAGSAAPGNGTGMTHLGGNNISLSNLGGPPTQGYSRARSLVGETPPDSPSHRAMGDRLAPGGTAGNFSTSTLDLNQRPTGRAPSAYLEDLFDEAGATPGNYPLNDSRHPNYQGGRI